MDFFKYQGTGNDFIIIDDRINLFDKNDAAYIKKLCDRKFGIGADGLILLRDHPSTDFEMIYFNSDGKETTMCGNGARCIIALAHQLKIFNYFTVFQAVDGLHKAYFYPETIRLKMIDVQKIERYAKNFIINTGSPHYISFVKELSEIDVYNEGRKIRYNEKFENQGGINVNFVEIVENKYLKIRTYERGVENETLSCGTGAVAASIAVYFQRWKPPIIIETLGGKLSVDFQKEKNIFTNIYLSGPAKEVFKGTI